LKRSDPILISTNIPDTTGHQICFCTTWEKKTNKILLY